jgi:hypothetical protein
VLKNQEQIKEIKVPEEMLELKKKLLKALKLLLLKLQKLVGLEEAVEVLLLDLGLVAVINLEVKRKLK